MKETVYISTHLQKDRNKGHVYGEQVYNELNQIPGINIKSIQNNNNNVWCRDYLPVKSPKGHYVQFTYAPSYMMDSKKWRERIPVASKIHKELEIEKDCLSSVIILDGGAIDICGQKAIVSDRVFRDNPNRDGKAIINEIKNKLGLKQLIVVPQYPYDFTGHVDGIARFIDEDRVVVNNLEWELKVNKDEKNAYRKKLIENWVYAFKYSLVNAGLELEYLPTSISEKSKDSSAEGIHLNFLLLNDMIIMPAYENEEINNKAAKKLVHLYKRQVIKIKATFLSHEGGAINCVTWTK